MYTDSYFDRFVLPEELRATLKKSRCLCYPETKDQLLEMCFGPTHSSRYDVTYPIPGQGLFKEAEVVRCKNGPVVNFMEDYMRRRDPDCMRIGDDLPTDKPRFEDTYGYPFSQLRQETLDWLATQQLIMLPFHAGGKFYGYDSLMICPMNAAFFALSLANMQGFVSIFDIQPGYTPRAIIYVAPPFRITHFNGKQVVVHNRSKELHEVFAYNLYPGPSAKKGVFSILLDIGENEGWVTNHASAAMLESPYENEIVFMHEGASGGGKSEMLEEVHKEEDGRCLLGTHTVSGEKYYINLGETCKIHPIADDMILSHKDMQNGSGHLVIADAEDGWFLRMDGDNYYGNSPTYERISIPPEDAQFIATRKFQKTEIATIYGVPPHMIADLERATNNNIEHQGMEFVQYCLMPYLVRLEEEFNRKLLREDEFGEFYFLFGLNGLLRGDAKTRSEYYKNMNLIGAMTAYEGGDEYFVQANMQTVEAARNQNTVSDNADNVDTDSTHQNTQSNEQDK